MVVIRGRPVRPGLQGEDGQHAAPYDQGEASIGSVDLEVLEDPAIGDQARPDQREVLNDQQIDGVRPHPVQESKRPHDQLEIGLIEGIAVVRVVPGIGGVVGVEVTGGDLLPGLAVLAEVGSEVEVIPEVPAVQQQEDQLDAENGDPEDPGRRRLPRRTVNGPRSTLVGFAGASPLRSTDATEVATGGL